VTVIITKPGGRIQYALLAVYASFGLAFFIFLGWGGTTCRNEKHPALNRVFKVGARPWSAVRSRAGVS